MIEILNTFTVNHKIAEIASDEIKIVEDIKALEVYRKELKEKHKKDINFTYREK